MIMLTSEHQDSAKYVGYIADYIAKFPQQVDGYTTSALRKSNNGDFAGADADMKQALKHATNKAEAHAEYSRVMYQKLIYSNDSLYKEWTLDKALGEAEEAYKIDPQLAYRHSAAQILFSKREYAKAYDIFNELSKTSFANSEVFYEAAQCKAQLGAKNVARQCCGTLHQAVYFGGCSVCACTRTDVRRHEGLSPRTCRLQRIRYYNVWSRQCRFLLHTLQV